MEPRAVQPPGRRPRESVVWIDRTGGLVVDPALGAAAVTGVIERAPGETGAALAARVVHEVRTSERVYVIGPAPERLEFEREFVAIVRAPERLVDVDPLAPFVLAAGREAGTTG